MPCGLHGVKDVRPEMLGRVIPGPPNNPIKVEKERLDD